MVSLNLDRCSKGLENQLFDLEVDRPGLRQQSILQKLEERFTFLKTVTLRGRVYVLDPRNMRNLVEKASLQQRERKQFIGRISKLQRLSTGEVKDLLLDLVKLGRIDITSVIGTSIDGILHFHYINSPILFQHARGLADAVHMSLFNLELNVRLPAKSRVTMKSHFGCRWYFSRNKSTPSKIVNTISTKERKFRLLLHYLRVFPKGLQEKEYVKMIKYSMNHLFSSQMEQELPSQYKYHIPIFPSVTQAALDRNLKTNRKLRSRLYFNILQSKSLCAPVGEDMILESYHNHQKSLCRPDDECVVVPEVFLEKLFLYGKRVGKEITERGLYQPYQTVTPNSKATVEKCGHEGGAAAELSPNRQKFKGDSMTMMLKLLEGESVTDSPEEELKYVGDSPTRLEPYVIGLFGPPGSGKTTCVQNLVRMLHQQHFPEMDFSQSVYSRSCSTSFWDGYENQPIVVLDDFGQNHEDRSDLSEFCQLVSTNRFVLQMADLPEKGRLFTSPFIIVTSNMAYGSEVNLSGKGPVLEEPGAVWRRFSMPLLLKPQQDPGPTKGPSEVFRYNLIYNKEKYVTKHKLLKPGMLSSAEMAGLHLSKEDSEPALRLGMNKLSDIRTLCEIISDEFTQRCEFHNEKLACFWDQRIEAAEVYAAPDKRSEGVLASIHARRVETPHLPNHHQIVQRFSSFPPISRPEVEAIALSEPLKVRMITKAQAETKVLKPLQIALFRYLGMHPQFALTNGCTQEMYNDFEDDSLKWIKRIEIQIQAILSKFPEKENLWLSGDYTAATDNFPMSVTNRLIEGILSEIDHEPTKLWARWEVSPHLIKYPEGKSGVQTSGQLMGSLLSFPLLCFLNDFIVSESGFPKGSYLINGDDVVARGNEEVINQWRINAPKVGLSLSLGKNFIDPSFCTVNSQLFYEGNCLHTGKVSCQTRYGRSLGYCFQEAQFYYGARDEIVQEFIRRNIVSLRNTPRSLYVSTEHGGLGLYTNLDHVDQKLARKVYLYDLTRRFMKSQLVPGFPEYQAVAIPEFHNDLTRGVLEDHGETDESIETMNILRSVFAENAKIDQNDSNGDLPHAEFNSAMRTLMDIVEPSLWDRFHKVRLTDLPILRHLRYRFIFVRKTNLRWIKTKIVNYLIQCTVAVSYSPSFENFGDQLEEDVIKEIQDQDVLRSCELLFNDNEMQESTFLPFQGFEDLLDSDFPIHTIAPKFFPHDHFDEIEVIPELDAFDCRSEPMGDDNPNLL